MHGGFATCCCVLLESDGTIVFASAGHLAPYMNETEMEITGGPPLGIDVTAEFPEMRLPLMTQLTLLSDGVVEATNAKGELFGFERTRQWSSRSSDEIADAAQAWGQNDDITVVTIRKTLPARAC
jgi:serine phosphatase RsbU (regulator of sigma subunit)